VQPAYDPKTVEPEWYARWEAAGLFTADASSSKRKYAICLPPPNVTGVLHMGHATNGTVQDAWARYRRMRGDEVLFLPGTDHAAIATQNVLERELAREGASKEQIGRAAFEERVERWYASVGQTIVGQLRELGCSLDWSRLRFTMDAAYVRAVQTAFVRFFERGWLYRGPRIVNWCPRCLSAISDEEVEWQEHDDTLYFIRYPLEGASSADEGITIATVRPETILADTGVAVHPEDERYLGLVGKRAMLPLVGRRLPIVADEAVERSFGSGALKVTPGHDQTDYEIGQRHGLPLIDGLHLDGRIKMPELPAYDGLSVDEARARVAKDLEAGGYLAKTEPYTHQVGHCDRCGYAIEPLVSEQWFLRMGELAKLALDASAARRVRWHPERYERTYVDWLRGLKDWCVSRQLWLGHRIPVFTCGNGHQTAAIDPPAECPKCGASELTQDPDVLDTWFSSALWPFATLGWPDDTPDLRAFYPTDMNCTDRQIINLWVSRMIMTGLHFMGDVPFHDVAIHATILSRDGRRMSKSKPETVVDPRDVMQKYGADALRAWCAQVSMSTQDVRFDDSRIEGYRRFCNKLWNATRLVLGSLPEGGLVPALSAGDKPLPYGAVRRDGLPLADRWILSRLQETVRVVTRGIEEFAFQHAMERLYAFAWHELCDWYLEATKPRLRAREADAVGIALHALGAVCQLLHPFMPFVTEELWHRLPGERDFLVRSAWPEADERYGDAAAEETFGELMRTVEAARQAKSKLANPQYRAKLSPGALAEDESRAAALPELVQRLQTAT